MRLCIPFLIFLGLASCSNQVDYIDRAPSSIKKTTVSAVYSIESAPITIIAGSLFNTKIRITNTSVVPLYSFEFQAIGKEFESQITSVVPLDSSRFNWRKSKCKEIVENGSVVCNLYLSKYINPGENTDIVLVWKAGRDPKNNIAKTKSIINLSINPFITCFVVGTLDCDEPVTRATTNISVIRDSDVSISAEIKPDKVKLGDLVEHDLFINNYGPHTAYGIGFDYDIGDNMTFQRFIEKDPMIVCDDILPGFSGIIHCWTWIGTPLDIQALWKIKIETKVVGDLSTKTRLALDGKVNSDWANDSQLTNNSFRKFIDIVTTP